MKLCIILRSHRRPGCSLWHGVCFKYRDGALKIYAMQLMVNLIWPFLFFSWGAYLMAFLWILLLGYLIYWTWKDFSQIDTRAGSLIFIYFLWVIYAGYLNLVIAIHSLI